MPDQTVHNADRFLRHLFTLAVAAADPAQTIPANLPEKPAGRVIVVGAGKASARMAEIVEQQWGPCEGLVITRYGYARPCEGIEIVEAAHPVPDDTGATTTLRMLEMLTQADPDDFVLALISGGGSALLTCPAGDISLAEKQHLNEALLASGAPIGKMNVVRKHLSRVKGGQLAAAAWPAHMLTLMISDVPGDDPAGIASGPTVGDASTPKDALAIIRDYDISIPQSIQAVLAAPTGVLPADAKALSLVKNIIIAAPSQSLDVAAEEARNLGLEVRLLGDDLEGEARDLGRHQATLALEIQRNLKPGDAPLLLLSGGECTVTQQGDGSGGPNAEYLLAAAITLQGAEGIHALACDTDGVDGAAEVAGAVIGPTTLSDAEAAGVMASDSLHRNDSHSFFATIDSQVITGPTLTNVNDFRAILIQPAGTNPV
jgi:glycerate 2-kinase